MICPKCNATIPDDSEFCSNCGAPIQAAQAEDPPVSAEKPISAEEEIMAAPDKANGKDSRAVMAQISFNMDYIGVIIGVLCIVIGLVFFATTSTSIHSTSFGADFYTYTYQGIVAVVETGVKLIKLLSLILILGGALVDCHYVKKIIEKQKKEM